MPSNFKGYEFHVDDTSNEFGRRIAQHEFPFHDVPFNEDMGRKSRVYNITGYVTDDDWERQRDDLIKACDDGDKGILNHPDFGDIEVICKSFVTTESKASSNRKCDLDFIFIEAGVVSKPATSIDTQVQLRLTTVSSMLALAKEFESLYNITRRPQFINDTVTDVLNSVSATVAKSTERSLVTSATALTNVDATAPADISTALLNIFQDDSDDGTLIKVYDSVTPAVIPMTTENRTTQSVNESLVINLVDNLSILSEVRKNTYTNFASHKDALNIRDCLLVKIDSQMEKNQSNDEIFSTLQTVRTEFVNDIIVRAPELSRIVNKTFNTVQPVLVIAYDFYGDATRENEIINRNNIRNPLIGGGGHNVELLSA